MAASLKEAALRLEGYAQVDVHFGQEACIAWEPCYLHRQHSLCSKSDAATWQHKIDF